jgi:hypothetical protein
MRDMGAVDHADRHTRGPLGSKYRVQGPTTNEVSPTKVSNTHWTALELDNNFWRGLMGAWRGKAPKESPHQTRRRGGTLKAVDNLPRQNKPDLTSPTFTSLDH